MGDLFEWHSEQGMSEALTMVDEKRGGLRHCEEAAADEAIVVGGSQGLVASRMRLPRRPPGAPRNDGSRARLLIFIRAHKRRISG